MDITKPLLSTISSASFSFLSTQDIKKISVKKIQNANLLDNTNSPTTGGLYDPALGPMKKNDLLVVSSSPLQSAHRDADSFAPLPSISSLSLFPDVQLVISIRSDVQVISVTLNCQLPFIILCSWSTCSPFSKGLVSIVTSLDCQNYR